MKHWFKGVKLIQFHILILLIVDAFQFKEQLSAHYIRNFENFEGNSYFLLFSSGKSCDFLGILHLSESHSRYHVSHLNQVVQIPKVLFFSWNNYQMTLPFYYFFSQNLHFI